MQSQVILLRDVEGFESDELRRILSVLGFNQRVLLHRARIKVQQVLAPYMDDSDPQTPKPCALLPCA